MKRIICMLLSVCMLLCIAACSGDHDPISGPTELAMPSENTEPTKGQIPETESIYDSDVIPTIEPTTVTEDQEDSSLIIFRQAMVETPQLFAVAYFGYVPQDANVDPSVIMEEAAPQLCEDLPFLQLIRKENIIGTSGHLFCIVPADENATVAVNRRLWNVETERYDEPEVLYRSEMGSPILVMCPNDNWMPDIEVIITDSNGNVAVWYPHLDSSYSVAPLCDGNGENMRFDFTSYDELPDPCWNQSIDCTMLFGTWELAWTEVEGDRNEAAPGVCTIEIMLDETGCFRFTYTNKDFPEENVQDRELLVIPGELYPGCSNDQWIGKVTEESGDTVHYALTLLEDGTLLLQTYWEFDGMPWVSYGWYTQVE